MLPSPLLSITDPVDSQSDESDQSVPVLDENTVYGILSNERRRRCLKLLVNSDDRWEVSKLSELVAADIAGPSQSGDDVYDSVYISMCQTHLPKLDDAGLVEYDASVKTVRTGPAADALRRYWFPTEEEEETTDDPDGQAPLALGLVLSACTVLGVGVGLLVPTLSAPLLAAVVVCNLVVLAVGLYRRLGGTVR